MNNLQRSNHQHIGRRKPAVHAAVAWLQDFAQRCGDRMPDSAKVHLPSCHSRRAVYDIMKAEFQELGMDVCSLTHFQMLWRTELSHITIPMVRLICRRPILIFKDPLKVLLQPRHYPQISISLSLKNIFEKDYKAVSPHYSTVRSIGLMLKIFLSFSPLLTIKNKWITLQALLLSNCKNTSPTVFKRQC